MGRKYKGDTARIDSEAWLTEGEAGEMARSLARQTRPSGIDPVTCRRAQAVALRQIQARMPSYF